MLFFQCHLLAEANDDLSTATSYSLAFALSGAGFVLVLTLEQLTIAGILSWREARRREKMSQSTDPAKIEQGTSAKAVELGEAGDLSKKTNSDAELLNNTAPECSTDCCAHEECACVEEVGHNHGLEVLGDLQEVKSLRDLVFLYALEISVSVHSVILGVEFGLTTSRNTLFALCIAMTFHQTLEGIAVGASVATFKKVLEKWKMVVFMLIFAFTVSIGVIIGIGVSFQGQSDAGETTQGVFSSLASGTLLYVALCEQINIYFNREDLHDQVFTKIYMIIGFSVGFGCMAALATWE